MSCRFPSYAAGAAACELARSPAAPPRLPRTGGTLNPLYRLGLRLGLARAFPRFPLYRENR